MTNYKKLLQLVETFNTQRTGRTNSPLTLEHPGWRVWTRFDGCRYTELGKIDTDNRNKHGAAAVEFFEWLKLNGAHDFGSVSGEFGSDGFSPAIKLGRIFLKLTTDYLIEWGDVSRLRNSSVWRHRGVQHETV
jgi:hypothetical protein